MPEAPIDPLLAAFGAGLLDPAATPADIFHGPGATARFALYRGNLTAHWQRGLAGAFPVLCQQVGDEFFRALARAYGRQVPSASGDLDQLGAGLADFLRDFPPVAAYPWFPALARLEWAVHQAARAADGAPVRATDLARLGAEQLDTLSLALGPAIALLAEDWSVARLWLTHQPGSASSLAAAIRRPSPILVYRPCWRVEVRPLGQGEFAALSALASPAPLGAALERGLEADASFDPGAALARWLTDRLLEHPS